MLKKLMLAMVASLVLVGGVVEAAPPEPQQFHLFVEGEMAVGEDGFLGEDNVDGGYPGLNSGFQKINKNTKSIVFQTCTPNCVPFSLGEEGFWWSLQDYPISEFDGDDCFPNDGEVAGAIHISKTKNGDAKAVFWFSAVNIIGDTVKYVLTLTGDGWIGDFPPPNLNDFAEMEATAWKMETEGKGQHRRTSCKDTGEFVDEGSAGVKFTVENVTPP